MIRLVLVLSLFTILASTHLPKWRARFATPFHNDCLKNTPSVRYKSEIQSLVCGSSLKNLSEQRDWKNLGLIHVLVVSGGHLSILAALLMHIHQYIHRHASRLSFTRRFFSRRIAWVFVSGVLILFSLGNRLQPPVLRALVEWLVRSKLERRGWRPSEISLITTWVALPFSSTIFDLLSLALSFFASVTVEQISKSFHRRPILQAISIQIAVWWILLPLLFTMGLPHPLTTMVNIGLAPLLGATLIPLAMLAWASHALPAISGEASDPLWLGFVFDFAWEKISVSVHWLATYLPQSSEKIRGTQALLPGPDSDFNRTAILTASLMFATCALLIRSRREIRREEIKKSRLGPIVILLGAILLSILIHHELR